MGWSAVVQVGALLFTTVIGVVLARGLGVHGYGQYGIAFAVISLLAVPGELGLPKLVMREVAAAYARNDSTTLRRAIVWTSRTALSASFCIAILAGIAVALLHGANPSPVYIAIAVGLPLLPLGAATSVRTGALMGLHAIVRGQIPVLLLRPILFSVLLLLLFGFSPNASAADAMALNLVTASAALLVARHWLSNRLPPQSEAKSADQRRTWLLSGLSLALVEGLRTFQGQVGMLIVGVLAFPEQAGLLRVALSAVLVVSLPVTLVETVTSPQFARLFALNDIAMVQSLATRAARLTAAGVITLTLPVLVMGKELLVFFFGTQFEPAYVPLVILCLGQIANAFFGMNLGLLLMTGHEKRLTRAMAWALLPNVVIAVLLARPLGATGVAIGAGTYVLFCNVLAWADARRLIGVSTGILGPGRRSAEA
jgi:O-antigen/teichoic acid export membrane protein